MAKKNLGLGLDVLLTASEAHHNMSGEDKLLERARSLLEKAIDQDELGTSFEAYYYYRQVIDLLEEAVEPNITEIPLLLSQALNNTAIILFENGQQESALSFLERALVICPENNMARENIGLLKAALE